MTLPTALSCLKNVAMSAALGCGAISPAAANPDVWVEVKYVLRFSDSALTRLSIDWTFDPFFSNRAIAQFDLDQNGVLSEQEVERLRVEFFDPLAERNYFVYLISGDRAVPISANAYNAVIEGEQLSFSFTLVPKAPIDYRVQPVAVSLHDKDVFYDFSLAEENFLLVDGPFDASCRFRVQTGDGALKGHQNAVVLLCGG